MIELQNISLQRGTRPLIKNSSLRIHPGEKIAVVGANGAGKTSLFRLLLGELAIDAGTLTIPQSWTIAHMAQEVSHGDRGAVDYVIDGDHELRQIEAQLPHAEDMALADLYSRLDAIDGYTAIPRAEQLLAGLGFRQEQLHAPINTFSGGWRIRLNLAQALMSRSDLLLLDEPTNHLDLDACLWLEQWLSTYRGTLILISHDRDFIDNTCDQVVHIDQQQLVKYRGNYSAFELQRAEKLAQQQAAHEQQQRRVAHFEQFIARFKAKASKAKQAQSRIKALERMQIIAPAHVDSGFSFSFAPPGKTSDPLLHMDRCECGYNNTVILDKVNLAIHPGSRIALLGANGAGKSTLLRTLAGAQAALQGIITPGEHLRIGYFTQHQIETLDPNASAALHLLRLSPKATEQQIRDFLGSFNFRGDRALEPIEPFSGGEKARLALALICWQKPNLLLLDEPTNHLDLDMCEALTEALQDFEGAIVLVSHDRHLVRNTADELLLVHDGKVEPFDGDLEDYSRWLVNTLREQKAASNKPVQDKKIDKKPATNNNAQLKALKKELNSVETQINTLQRQLSQYETELADSALYEAQNKTRLQQVTNDQRNCQAQLNQCEEQWFELQEKIEAIS